MNCRCAAVGLSLLGCLMAVSNAAYCAQPVTRPLQLQLLSIPVSGPRERPLDFAPRNPAPSRAAPAGIPQRPATSAASLRRRAVESLLDSPARESDEAMSTAPPSDARFHFQRRGPAFRDLARGYRDMCTKVSGKLWDDPNGRRIRFDIAGKPGVAFEIPIR